MMLYCNKRLSCLQIGVVGVTMFDLRRRGKVSEYVYSSISGVKLIGLESSWLELTVER